MAPIVARYLTFLALIGVVIVAPGPDTFLTLRNAATAGRAAGLATVAGVTVANVVQGLLAATGLGALLVHAEPVFLAVKWAGVAYLVYLGVMAIRSAVRGAAGWSDLAAGATGRPRSTRRMVRQGFLCNITNPKVLVFNLAVLPQFVGPDTGVPSLLLYALSLAVLGGAFLVGVVLLAGAVAGHLRRTRVRQALDASVGTVMIGFATALAAEG